MCCLVLDGFVSGKIVGPLCVLCMVSSREGCLLEAFCTESKVRCCVEECAQAAERLVLDKMEQILDGSSSLLSLQTCEQTQYLQKNNGISDSLFIISAFLLLVVMLSSPEWGNADAVEPLF